MINEYRLVPKGTKIWSIKNQTNLILDSDEIVQVTHTIIGNDDIVFVKSMQLIFNIVGFFPTLIGKGIYEWELKYSDTKPYEVPFPEF